MILMVSANLPRESFLHELYPLHSIIFSRRKSKPSAYERCDQWYQHCGVALESEWQKNDPETCQRILSSEERSGVGLEKEANTTMRYICSLQNFMSLSYVCINFKSDIARQRNQKQTQKKSTIPHKILKTISSSQKQLANPFFLIY